MALWRKSLPATFYLSRYAPPLRCPMRNLFSTGFIIPGDIRAATSVELLMSNCAAQPVYPPKTDDPNRSIYTPIRCLLSGVGSREKEQAFWLGFWPGSVQQ
ncbi:hypothetical protein AMECASPLE_039219 [Ameca splendens]|uniref:Uncharacterized protein n=1 Tax=Ameca splendens TaxID=208324 RepID=A0ABV0XXG5_9TELE